MKYTEDEQETQTVEKTLTIYVGDETGDDRYVKVDDSKEVYTITKDSLTDILDSTMSDFYNLTVSYVSSNDLDSLEVQSADGDHTINVVTETVKRQKMKIPQTIQILILQMKAVQKHRMRVPRYRLL